MLIDIKPKCWRQVDMAFWATSAYADGSQRWLKMLRSTGETGLEC